MTYRSSEHNHGNIHLPTDVNWEMLDKSKFFVFGAALFSCVSVTLYPFMVLKTRQQVSSFPSSSSFKICGDILRYEGVSGLYRGFPTSLLGTIPARVLYMSTLEITKSTVGSSALELGFSDSAAAITSNAVGGLAASVAAQLVWTPVDVISQRLMVQVKYPNLRSDHTRPNSESGYVQLHRKSETFHPNPNAAKLGNLYYMCKDNLNDGNVSQRVHASHGSSTVQYKGGIDAFRSIIKSDGWKGLYRGFGMSILTYAPSNALWWTSYCLAQRTAWNSLGYSKSFAGDFPVPSTSLVFWVQGASAACAGGVTSLLTTPLDTIKTRLQVLSGVENRKPTVRETLTDLIREGGWIACYRGVGPRWSMMVMSAITMVTTYETLKRLSKKKEISETL